MYSINLLNKSPIVISKHMMMIYLLKNRSPLYLIGWWWYLFLTIFQQNFQPSLMLLQQGSLKQPVFIIGHDRGGK